MLASNLPFDVFFFYTLSTERQDSMTEAFWIAEEENLFRATSYTQGPWSPQFQHGGPPAALLVRQIEHCSPREDMMLARITIDIFGPVPIATLSTQTRILRPGRSVELLESVLEYDGRPVMRASAWRVRLPNDRPSTNEPESAPPIPQNNPTEAPGSTTPYGFGDASEWRNVRGGYMQGAATAWVRFRLPLIAGEPMSPYQRLIAATDSANGISSLLDIRSWQFVPPELTLHIMRPPLGEWICLDAVTHLQTEGVGLTTTRLFDQHGLVGYAAQTLFIARRA